MILEFTSTVNTGATGTNLMYLMQLISLNYKLNHAWHALGAPAVPEDTTEEYEEGEGLVFVRILDRDTL